MLSTYTCTECGKSVVTIDRAEGTTPFGIACRTAKCKGFMTSSKCEPMRKPTWEWVKVPEAHYDRFSPQLVEYFKGGGLALRKIGSRTYAQEKR